MMVLLPDNEAEVVRRAQGGEQAAFARLAGHYRAWLLALAFLRTGDREEAEDLVQEVLARAWEKLPSLRQPEAFAGWLRQIMQHACQSWQRGRGRWPLSLEEAAPAAPVAVDPPAVLLARERQRAVRAALLSLAPDNRLALLLHLWGDYSYAEIARLLDVSLSTVDGRIYRAKQHLRRLLHEQAGELFAEPRRRWRAKED